MIASRRIEKVLPADDFSGVSIAGAAGPAIEMVNLFQVQLEPYETVPGEPPCPAGTTNTLGHPRPANPPRARPGPCTTPSQTMSALRKPWNGM